MSLFEKHKSIIEGNAPFGVVIENNTNKDTYVDFMGHKEIWNYFKPEYRDGIKVYPLYNDLYFSDMSMLHNYILSKGCVFIEVTKFQSSLMFEIKKKYYLTIKHTDAHGQTSAIPMYIKNNPDELLEYTKNIDFQYLIDGNTSFGMTIEKYTDMVIKFYPSKREIKYNLFSDSFYNKIKTEDVEKLNEEKRKRIRIII